jgi:TPR repeat protein
LSTAVEHSQVEQARLKYLGLQKAENTRKATAAVLKSDIKRAEDGDPDGLSRMAERYKTGDGVEIDLTKAKIYSDKAAEAGKTVQDQEEKDKTAQAQAVLQKKIQWAENNGGYGGAIFLGKCYRDGNGVEKNLDKAREYFQKAIEIKQTTMEDAGEASKLLGTCQ